MFSRATWRAAMTTFSPLRPSAPFISHSHTPTPLLRSSAPKATKPYLHPNLLPRARPFATRRLPPRQPHHNQQSQHYQQPPFPRLSSLLHLFRTSPSFRLTLYVLSGGSVTFYILNLETVPISGRRRFNWVRPEWEKKLAQESFEGILEEFGGRVLPEWAPETRRVNRVLERLVPNIGTGLGSEGEGGGGGGAEGMGMGGEWEVRVVRGEEVNAFVMPGNKVFVFTGILPICENDDGLAAVLGHEIAHNLAHHSAENLSRYSLLILGSLLIQFFLGLDSAQLPSLFLDLAFHRPGSRKQETEADHIGLLMMAKSCYDPREAVRLWERMEIEDRKRGGSVPALLSTHPSSGGRRKRLEGWLPEAAKWREGGECGWVGDFADPFYEAAKRYRQEM